jgi:protein O-mannosyl-transferase
MNERFMFMPSVGFAIAAAGLLSMLIRGKGWTRPTGIALLFLFAAGFSVRTIARNRDWKDDFTLFRHDIRISAASAKCNYALGQAYLNELKKPGQEAHRTEYINKCRTYMMRGLEIYADYPKGYVVIGQSYMEESDPVTASRWFAQSMKVLPNMEALYYLDSMAVMLKKINSSRASADAFAVLAATRPNEPMYAINLADQLARIGQADSAVRILDRLLKRFPENGSAWGKLGVIWSRYLGNHQEGLRCQLLAVKFEPGNAANYTNLGLAYYLNKELPAAIENLQKAYSMKPGDAGLLRTIAQVYQAAGDKVHYEEYLNKAAELGR